MQTFRFFDNTGGMNLKSNDISIPNGDAEEITNLHATSQGSWSNQNCGYIHLNTVPLGAILPVRSLYHYKPLIGSAQFIAVSGTSLYQFETSTGSITALYNLLSNNLRMNFVTFNGLLIGCNGVDAPIKWDGQNEVVPLLGWTSSITTIPIGVPSISETFANRLVFSGDPVNPSMLFISEQENPENFTPDGSVTSPGLLQVSPGDGERITALKSLFLPLSNEEVLVIFKERSTYLLSGTDSESFLLQKISGEFGAVSHLSLAVVGNELMFLSNEGVTSLSTATLQGNLTTGFLSDRIRSQIVTLNRVQLSNTFAVHMRNRQEVWWFVPDGSSSENQLVLIYNYGINRAWSKRTGIKAASGCSVNGKLYTCNLL